MLNLLKRFWDWLYWGKGGSRYASFERRIMASAIDTVLLSITVMPLVAPLLKGANPARQQLQNLLIPYQQGVISKEAFVNQVTQYMIEGGGGELLIRDAGYQAIVIGIVVLIFWFCRNATPGKMLLNMEIVDAKTGGKPKPWQWVLRYLGYVVAVVPLMLGFAWIMWDKKRQGWHDKIAGTVVVLKEKK